MTDIPINDVNRRVQFTSNTGTGPFAFTFEVLDQTDIEVYKNRILLTLTTDYTVTVNANGTGSITLVSALVATDVLTIIGSRAYSRTTDFTAGGDLRAAALNEQLDSNIIMAQQLDEILSRTVRVHPGDTNLNLTLPSSADRSNGFLSFDSNGNVAINSVVDLSFLTLERLDIDNVRIDGNTVSSTTGSLILAPTADVEINIPASSSLYMQRAGTTALDFAFTSISQEVRFINTTTATTYSVIQSNHLGGTSSDLILKSDGGPLELDTGGGTIPLKDDGVQRGYLNINTANTIKLYTGTGTGTLNTTFDGADVTIAGELVVSGNLTVDGTTTTINSTTLTVDDKNIVLASGASTSLAADGAGITIDGASASLTYVHLTGAMTFNKDVDIGDNDIENAQKLHFTENVSLYPSSGDDSILNLQAEDVGSAQLRFITGTGSGVFRGGIVASQNNVFGLKDSNEQTFIKSQDGNLPTQIFHTYDSPSAGSSLRIEAGSNFVKLYGSEGVEAQKYKDADDTSYYLEPAGTSVLATVGATQLNVDNITIDGNTISSTDTNGNINLRCNGSGVVDVDSELFVYGNAINGTSAYVQIGNTDTGGDDIRIQGPNPNFTLYDSTAVADGVAAYTGGVSFRGQKTNTAYHTYSTIRPRIINGLDSDTARTGALHFGVSDGANAATTNIIFKIEPDGIEVAGNITSTNDPLKISATTTSSTANIILEGDASPILSLRASGSNDDKITFKSDGAFQYINTNDQLTIQTGTNDALFLFGSSNIRTDAISGTHTISSRAGDISFITGTSGSTTERMRIAGAGGISVSADMTFGDNDKAIFGAGSDLQIYHDGSNSIIKDNGAGDLRIMGSDDVRIVDAVNEENMARFNRDGAVTLYYDNAAKIATTSTGIDVTGTVTADGLTVEGNAASTLEQIALSNNNSSFASGLKISASFDSDNEEYGNLTWTPRNGTQGYFQINNLLGGSLVKALEIDGNDISFYEDTGTTAKFFWDASAESLGIGTSSPAYDLHIHQNDSTNALIHFTNSATGSTGTDGFTVGLDAAEQALIMMRENNPMLFYTNATERMRIDSSGNLLVGKTSSNTGVAGTEIYSGSSAGVLALAYAGRPLYINRLSTDGGIIDFAKDGSTVGSIASQSSGTQLSIETGSGNEIRVSASGALTLEADREGNGGGDYIDFRTAGSEKARLDASGNLLVGKTASNYSTTGTQLSSNGQVTFTSDGNTTLQINRKTSDGAIQRFSKDGTTVGSIGVATTSLGTNPYIAGSGGRGLSFDRDQNVIFPCSSVGARADGSADLGASTARFKDLYLSGGVYLGGTGAANKLDDYEEGTWTPTYTSTDATNPTFTPNLQNGRYTKIGRTVIASFRIRGAVTGTKTGSTRISGLPFTASSDQSGNGGSIRLTEVFGADNYPASLSVTVNGAEIILTKFDSADPRDGMFDSVPVSSLQTAVTGNYIIGQVIYDT